MLTIYYTQLNIVSHQALHGIIAIPYIYKNPRLAFYRSGI